MKSQFKCPICQSDLEITPGTQLSKEDGVRVSCPQPVEVCGMADWGHGVNEAKAFEVFKQKCGF
jgi:hypothetical protein